MERVSLDGRDDGEGVATRRLSAALGAEHVAVNHYRVPPGEGFPAGLHAHMDQEEVFVVLDGGATFETLDGRVTVRAGEAIRFAPGEFQTGVNEGDETLVALALGAPRYSDEVRLPLDCPDCGHDDLRLDTDRGVTFDCPDCGTEHVPAPCPECDSEDLGVRLGPEGRPVVVCGDCGASFDSPPLVG